MSCPVCQSPSYHIGNVDFNRSAADAFVGGRIFKEEGEAVGYNKCISCSLVFSPYFINWNDQDFSKWVYNDNYILVDSPYVEELPRQNAKWLMAVLAAANVKQTSIFDYGMGNGRFLDILSDSGFSTVAGVDKYPGSRRGDLNKFYDIVTCFEVMEHVLNPQKVIQECIEVLKPDGAFVFSTVLQPTSCDEEILDWWYLAPRNGHVTGHTHESLRLATPEGYTCKSKPNSDIHIIHRTNQTPSILQAFFEIDRPDFLPGEPAHD